VLGYTITLPGGAGELDEIKIRKLGTFPGKTSVREGQLWGI
jgi:hypothetical protein